MPPACTGSFSHISACRQYPRMYQRMPSVSTHCCRRWWCPQQIRPYSCRLALSFARREKLCFSCSNASDTLSPSPSPSPSPALTMLLIEIVEAELPGERLAVATMRASQHTGAPSQSFVVYSTIQYSAQASVRTCRKVGSAGIHSFLELLPWA